MWSILISQKSRKLFNLETAFGGTKVPPVKQNTLFESLTITFFDFARVFLNWLFIAQMSAIVTTRSPFETPTINWFQQALFFFS